MLSCIASKAVDTILFNPFCIPCYKIVSNCLVTKVVLRESLVDLSNLRVVCTLAAPLCLKNLGNTECSLIFCLKVGEICYRACKVAATVVIVAC